MNPKVNYLVVGIFVVLLFSATVIFALWLAFGYGEASQKIYLINMNESVAGLSQDAFVKFNGVNVGKIKEIALGQDPEQVLISISVNADTPITVDTRATLMSQGLTGLSYINLSGGTRGSKKLLPRPGEDYAIIPTNPSLLVRLDTSINVLDKSLKTISESVNTLLSSRNQKNIAEILTNLQQVTKAVANHADEIGQTLHGMPQTVQAMGQTFNEVSTQTLPSMNTSLMQLSNTLPNVSHFAQEIAEDPSILWRGSNMKNELGPGEQQP